MTDDVASGAWQFLTGQPDVLAVVGAFPADDPDNANIPWIFVRNVYTRMEDVSIVKHSQAVSLVCVYQGQSTPPLMTSTVQNQRLEVDIWVDPLRDVMGNVTSPSEAEGRGNAVFSIIDSHLHRMAVNDNMQQWGDLVTVGSLRMAGPVWSPVPDGDGLIRGVCMYDVGCYGNYDPTIAVGSADAGTGA